MRKMIMAAVLAVVVLIWCATVFSQQRPPDAATTVDIFQRLNEIEAKIDRMAASRGDDSSKQVLSKLDQVLENQRKVDRELEIIRIRVSR